MYDINILEKLFLNNNHTLKYDTEKYLTDYYQLKEMNPFKSAEYAQANIINFIEYANQCIKSAKQDCISFIFNRVTKDIVEINIDYFRVKNIHEKLLALEWRDFEFLSSTILEHCFGAFDVRTSQPTSDGGVDFLGKIPILSSETKEKYGVIEVYGQSKKYNGNVGINDIKSFVAFADGKKRNFVHKPQLFIFFTTSDFSNGANEELSVNGFIGLSGFQLATLIFKHKKILQNKTEIIRKILS